MTNFFFVVETLNSAISVYFSKRVMDSGIDRSEISRQRTHTHTHTHTLSQIQKQDRNCQET